MPTQGISLARLFQTLGVDDELRGAGRRSWRRRLVNELDQGGSLLFGI